MGRDPYRRYRRQMRRYGRNRDFVPVLMPGPYEPFAFLLLAAVSRWVYRHRSALAPFTIALAALITAAILHAHHARWWIPIAVITALTAVALGFPHALLARHPAGAQIAHGLYRLWAAIGIDRAIERAYATVVITVTGTWLSVAIAIGPLVKPLPQIEGISAVILGVPWWCHRGRREKVRVERIINRWPELAENIGLPGVHITSAVVDVWGWTARVILKKGTTSHQVTAKIPDIESGLGLRPGSIRITPDPDRANRLTLRVAEKDPHAQPIGWPGTGSYSASVRALAIGARVVLAGLRGFCGPGWRATRWGWLLTGLLGW